jgi:hypothetical protein
MAKKDKDQAAKHDEELEHDDEHDEEGHDEDEEEEDEEAAVSAKPVSSARSGRAQARARRAAKPPVADDHDDHDHHDDDAYDDDDDPYWWSPYAVMAGLVLVGILGFVGVFNKLLGGIAAHPASADVPASSAVADVKPALPTPHPQPRPGTPPMPGMNQPGSAETFGAKHLLVMYKGSRRAPPGIERTKEEAKKRAEEADKKAKAPGAKFEELVKEYSDEPGAGARGGDLGTFRKGSMVPEFQDALDKMKVGDVSGVVETPFGYHVILRTK